MVKCSVDTSYLKAKISLSIILSLLLIIFPELSICIDDNIILKHVFDKIGDKVDDDEMIILYLLMK